MRLLVLALPLLLAACGRNHDANQPSIGDNGVRQTHFAGMVTAGGHTSGEVMAATGTRATPEPGPAGTPGIPKGAGGNTSGAALGGTTPSTPTASAAAGPASAASAAMAPASAASAPAMSDAQRQAQELAAVQDMVAARWKARAASQGWQIQPAVAAASAAASAPQPIQSEKFGTAPPSPDVKTATKPATQPMLDPKAPSAAGPH